jgi:hypothetical protein
VTAGLREAREHFDSDRFEDASRAAGNVLSLVPGHAEARQLMQDAAARSRGRGAAEARTRMNQAKSAARSAGAPNLAPAPYNAALGVERTAQRLYDAGQLADATARFYEASGLFRSAELAAQSENASRAEAAKAQSAEPERAAPQTPASSPASPTTPPVRPPIPEPLPAPPVTRGTDPLPMGGTPVPAPPPPKPAAQPAPAQSPEPPPPSDQSLIAELLTRYESALEDRSLSALKRLWPGLGGAQESAIRNEFQHASRIDVEIASPRIEVSGATASATFLRRYGLVTTDGQRLNSQSTTTMTLRRTAAGWVIDQIRFEPFR